MKSNMSGGDHIAIYSLLLGCCHSLCAKVLHILEGRFPVYEGTIMITFLLLSFPFFFFFTVCGEDLKDGPRMLGGLSRGCLVLSQSFSYIFLIIFLSKTIITASYIYLFIYLFVFFFLFFSFFDCIYCSFLSFCS